MTILIISVQLDFGSVQCLAFHLVNCCHNADNAMMKQTLSFGSSYKELLLSYLA